MSSIYLMITVAFVVLLYRQDQKEWPQYSFSLWIPLLWLLSSTTRIVPILFSGGRSQTAYDVLAESAERSTVGGMVAAALSLITVFLLLKRRSDLLLLLRANQGILILYAYIFLSVAWSDYPMVSLKRFIRFCGCLFFAFVVASENDHHAALEHVFRRYVAICLTLSLFFIRTNRSIGYVIGMHGHHFMAGISHHKNELGILCAFSIVFLCWRAMKRWPTVNHLDGILILINAYLLIRVKSATALVVALLGIALIMFMKYVRENVRNRMILVLALIVAAIPLLFFALNSPESSVSGLFFDSVGRNATLTGRIPMWKALIDLGKKDLIMGSGYASFWTKNLFEIWQMFTFGPTNAHNGFVDVLLNLGLIGLIIVVVILLRAVFLLVADVYLSKPYSAWAFTSILMFILANITETALLNLALGWHLFLALLVNIEKDRYEQLLHTAGALPEP